MNKVSKYFLTFQKTIMDSVGAFWISSGLLDNIELNITEDGLLNMTLEDLDVGDVQVKSGSSKIPNTRN